MKGENYLLILLDWFIIIIIMEFGNSIRIAKLRGEKTMEQYLLVIDMQNDFVDGSLGTKKAAAIVPDVVKKIEEFDGTILYTLDTHMENYLTTQEGKNLPVVHCVKDSKGWELNKSVKEAVEHKHGKRFLKETFGSKELAEYLVEQNKEHEIEKITVIGLCTDICVISNALLIKAFLPEVPVHVDALCCAGVTEESHQRALDAMKMCQILID